jgi:hypothetical protein
MEEYNDILQQDAQDYFSEKVGRELSLSCERLERLAQDSIEAMKNNQSFEPFGDFDSDEIARIYVTDTIVDCEGYYLDMSDRKIDSDDWRDFAIETSFFVDGEGTVERNSFIDYFEKYLRAAAKLAKSIKSDAAKTYREALALSKETKAKYNRLLLSAEEALKLVSLEKTATKTLLEDLNKFNGRGN